MAEKKEEPNRFGWGARSSSREPLTKQVKLSPDEKSTRKTVSSLPAASTSHPTRIKKDEPNVSSRRSQGQGKLNTQERPATRISVKKNLPKPRGQQEKRRTTHGPGIKKEQQAARDGAPKESVTEDMLNGNETGRAHGPGRQRTRNQSAAHLSRMTSTHSLRSGRGSGRGPAEGAVMDGPLSNQSHQPRTDGRDENQNPKELISREEGEKTEHLQIHRVTGGQKEQSLDNENSTAVSTPAISDVLGNTIRTCDPKSPDINVEKYTHKSNEQQSVSKKPRHPESLASKTKHQANKRKEIDGSKSGVPSATSTKRIASHTAHSRQSGQSKKDEQVGSKDSHQSRSKLSRRDKSSGIPVVRGKRSDPKPHGYRESVNNSEKVRVENARKPSKDADRDIDSDRGAANTDSNGNLASDKCNLNLTVNEGERKKQGTRRSNSRYSLTHGGANSEALPKNIQKLSKSGKRESVKGNAKETQPAQAKIPHTASSKSVNKSSAESARKSVAWPGMHNHADAEIQYKDRQAVPSHSSKGSSTYSQPAQVGNSAAVSEASKPPQKRASNAASGRIPADGKEVPQRREKTPSPGLESNLHACVREESGKGEQGGLGEAVGDTGRDTTSQQRCVVERQIKTAASEFPLDDINNSGSRPSTFKSTAGYSSAKSSPASGYNSQLSLRHPPKLRVAFDENTTNKISSDSRNNKTTESSKNKTNDLRISPTVSNRGIINAEKQQVRDGEKCAQKDSARCNTNSQVQATPITVIKEPVIQETSVSAGNKSLLSKLPISRSSSLRSFGAGNSINEDIRNLCADNETNIKKERQLSKDDIEKQGKGKPHSDTDTKESLDRCPKGLTDCPKTGDRVNHGKKIVKHESGFRKLANLAKHLSQQWSKPRTYVQIRQEPRQTKSDTTLLQERRYAQRERDNLYGYSNRESNKSKSLFSRSKYSKSSDVNKRLLRGQSEKALHQGVDLRVNVDKASVDRSNFVISRATEHHSAGNRVSGRKKRGSQSDKEHSSDSKASDGRRKRIEHEDESHIQELGFIPTRWKSDLNIRRELTLEFIDAESNTEEGNLFEKKTLSQCSPPTGDALLSLENIYGIETLVTEIDKLSTDIHSEAPPRQMPDNTSLGTHVVEGSQSKDSQKGTTAAQIDDDDEDSLFDASLDDSSVSALRKKINTTMPFGCGNKVSMVDVDDDRRKQVTVKRGASCPSETSRLKTKDNLRSVRPKSADFDAKGHKSCDIPCFRKTHARSPSDGTIDILEIINSQTAVSQAGPLPEKADVKLSAVQTVAVHTSTTTSVTFQKPSRKDVRVTLTPSSPKSPGLLHKVFSFKRSPMLRGAERQASPGQSDAGEAPCSVQDLGTSNKSPSRDMCIKLKRYHSLSRKEGCPTPPLAVFSSSEDIASLPQTPKQESSPLPGTPHSESKHESQAAAPTLDSSASPSHGRTISPELEEEIGKLLLEPPKYKTYQLSESDTGSRRSPPPSLMSCHSVDSASETISSPTSYHHFQRQMPMIAGIPVTKTYAGYLQKKYASLRHHSTDLSVPLSTGYNYSTRTVNTPGIAVATSKSCGTQVTYSSQRRNQEYVRRRHHTVDIPYIGTPKTKESSLSTCVAVTCDAEVLGTVVTAVGSSLQQTSISPASPSRGRSTSSPDRPHVRIPPWRPTSREDSPHWSPLCEDMSPWRQPPRDVPEQLLLSDVASNDSGIQDETPSSTESFRLQHQLDGIMARHIVCRASPGVSPGTSPERHGRERPKSDCLTVRWADTISEELFPVDRRRRRVPLKERPKSDLGGRRAISEALQNLGVVDSQGDSVSPLPYIPGTNPTQQLPERKRIKSRRMSTPSPIKSRSVRSPPKLRSSKKRIKKSKSAPDLLETCSTYSRTRRKILFHASSMEAGDLAVRAQVVYSSDEDEASEDGLSIAASETSSASSTGKQNLLDEIFEEKSPTFAEALWDHVTMDPDELGFRAGDVIEVTDQADKDWWWGRIHRYEGWFPATFVRIRANQSETADDLAQKVKDGAIDSNTALRRYSNALLSKEQARTNVVQEIINAEREYVKHLRDVVEGYVEKARKRPEMFPEDRLRTIFGNIEDIYMFSATFLSDLEKNVRQQAPHLSELGQVFIRYKRGFEIYSEYCNNHPHACEELQSFQKNRRYQHFFEACRLLQEMIEIPLEGFLLTPVQKICKYPLQLKELLKYTRSEHPDYEPLQRALDSMRQIAVLINERKRKMESIEKLAEWQESVDDWQGPDILESSSELIYSGELTKVNSAGWHQERVFFLFDHQMIYCKKDLLWRDMMVYKGRINTDNCVVHPIQDGKDITFNVNVKHAFKIYDHVKEKWYLLYCRNSAERDRWLKAFQEERSCCKKDKENGFNVKDFRRHVILPQNRQHSRTHPQKHKGKQQKQKDGATGDDYNDAVFSIPSHVTLPRQSHVHGGKRSWFPFRKTKR